MNLVPRSPFHDVEKFFDQFFKDQPESKSVAFSPRVDIKRDKKKYLVEAELPGVDEKDIKVELDDNVLSINASLETEKDETEDGKVIRKERHFGQFHRSFYIDDQIEKENIKANFKNGLLKITVPFSEPKDEQRKQISINQ